MQKSVETPVTATTTAPRYAELQVTTNFSFLTGGSHPQELVAQAKALGLSALAVTDRNTLAGVVRAHAAAKEVGLDLIVGSRLDLDDAPSLLCLPTDRRAYGRLSRLLSLGQGRAGKGRCSLSLDDVAAHAEGQILIVLPPEDWAVTWRKVWKPLRVGRLCILTPEWKGPLRPGDVPLCFEPGAAFGTGRHATTRRALVGLQQRLRPGERVLDAGCGSGLLGVAACLLGDHDLEIGGHRRCHARAGERRRHSIGLQGRLRDRRPARE